MSEKESVSSRYFVCQFSSKTKNFEFFVPNLPKNEFRVGNSENQCRNKNQHPRDTMFADFQAKQTTLTVLAQICPKKRFGIGISKI